MTKADEFKRALKVKDSEDYLKRAGDFCDNINRCEASIVIKGGITISKMYELSHNFSDTTDRDDAIIALAQTVRKIAQFTEGLVQVKSRQNPLTDSIRCEII